MTREDLDKIIKQASDNAISAIVAYLMFKYSDLPILANAFNSIIQQEGWIQKTSFKYEDFTNKLLAELEAQTNAISNGTEHGIGSAFRQIAAFELEKLAREKQEETQNGKREI